MAENRLDFELLREISRWPIEAKEDDTVRYFYETEDLPLLLDGSKCFVIGRKGTGKTAIAEHIDGTEDYQHFSKKLSFKNFPFNSLYRMADKSFTNPNQYISAWKLAILTSILQMFMEHAECDPRVQSILRATFPNPVDTELRGGFSRLLERGIDMKVLGTGMAITAQPVTSKGETEWSLIVQKLEEFAKQISVSGNFYILFDELDEDYRDILSKPDIEGEYFQLITSLFKAAQDIRYIFRGSNAKILPIIFLRSDIYDLVRDPDKNKWRDKVVDLDWSPLSLRKLLAYRISKANNAEGAPLSFDDAWKLAFAVDQTRYGNVGRKRKETFHYLLDSTYLRPRDLISYVRECADIAHKTGAPRITNEIIKEADERHSLYSRGEIVDEMQSIVPYIDDILNVISYLGKSILPYQTLNDNIDSYLSNRNDQSLLDSKKIIDLLFYFGVIGNIRHADGARIFSYMGTHIKLNDTLPLCIHRSLLKSLQL